MGYVIKSYTNIKEDSPSLFRTSLYYKPKYLSAIIGIDFINHLNKKLKNISIGIKFNYTKKINFRLGCSSNRNDFYTGDFSSDFFSNISGGIGTKFNKVKLDIGFMNIGAAGYILGFSINHHY